MQEVKSQSVSSGVETVFEFNSKGSKFLIKNFSTSYIRACLGDTFDIDKSIRIKEDCFEELSNDNGKFNTYDKVVIMPEGDGEVEIQCLKK